MPSSLLPSRCALRSVSISSSNLALVSSRCSCALSKNPFRLSFTADSRFDFLGMTEDLLHSFRAGHSSTQVVGQCLVDTYAHKLAGRRFTLEEDRAVNLGRLRLAAPAHPRGPARNGALDQHL